MFFSRHRARHGLSIVEILVALAIFSVGIYAIYGQFLDLTVKDRQLILGTQARFLAQQELEQLRAIDFESLKAYAAPESPQPIADRPNLQRQITITELDNNRLNLSVRIGWNIAPGASFEPGNSIELTGVKSR